MTSVFNWCKGEVAYWAKLPAAGDGLILVLLSATGVEDEDLLKDRTTLADVLTASTQHPLGRKAVAAVTDTVDHTSNSRTIGIPPVDFPGTSVDDIGAIVVCYTPTAAAPSDATTKPLYMASGPWTPGAGGVRVDWPSSFLVDDPDDTVAPPPIYNRPVTHGDQLTVNDVGPWALQEVPKGTESYATVAPPSSFAYRFDNLGEFTSATAWPANANDANPSILNNPALNFGRVTGSPVTIDGYSIPVGTYVCQFVNWASVFYCQGTDTKILFRGCRFRYAGGTSGAGLFNDNTATVDQQIMLHYCDLGMTHVDDMPNGESGYINVKYVGGRDHRTLRCHATQSSTFFQPNVNGCTFTENMLYEFVFPYGELGPNGNGDSATLHVNGISCEGGLSSLVIERNSILAASPDGAVGSQGTSPGQGGYGTQPGQTGYGIGSNPGRLLTQTDCIALFQTLGGPYTGTPGAIRITDNFVGGSGYPIYAGGAGSTGITLTGNKVTTKWWNNGGSNGAVADAPTWGTGNNVQSGNVWADDYGTGGNGATAVADRQFPTGNGPRVGTPVI